MYVSSIPIVPHSLGKILSIYINSSTVVLESKLQVDVTPEMFAKGGRIAQEALDGMPSPPFPISRMWEKPDSKEPE